MNRITIAALLLTLGATAAPAQDADDAMKLAVKLTTEGAATFNTKDAQAMAAYYAEDAQLDVVSKDKDTGEIKTETKSGRAAIEEFYRDLFKDAGTIQARNTVEYARRLDPDVLVIAGFFEPDLTNDGLRVPFYQVRHRRGEKWLMASLRIFILPEN
jgi:hypothetical protein